MPWPVYSERILASTGALTERIYTVPTGKRFVIRNVVFTNGETTAVTMFCTLGGRNFVQALVPASSVREWGELRMVAYGGEKITTYIAAGVYTYAFVAGYLMVDNSLGKEPDVEESAGPPDYLRDQGVELGGLSAGRRDRLDGV